MLIAYLLDENVSEELQAQIHKHKPELTVWRVGTIGAPPISTLDPDILLWCERNGFVLVTNNRASMPVHLREHVESGHHVPGIFILNRKMDLGETIQELILIAGVSDKNEYHNTIQYLPISYDVLSQ